MKLVGLAYSSDGIHWSNYNNSKPVTHRAADCFDQILWDPIMKKYRLICRTDIGGQSGAKEYRSARIMVHDKGCVFPPSQFLTHKDERWIFYGAASERHYSIGRDMKIRLAKRSPAFPARQRNNTKA